jgi:hypothetical protein
VNLRSPAFAILFSVSLIAAAGNMALQSVLPAIGREFELSDTLVAGAFAISALMWTVASPFWARLSDRLGRKRVMMIGLGGFILSMSGFGLAATSGLEQWLSAGLAFVLMAVARTVYGVFGSAAPIASQAYVADRTTPRPAHPGDVAAGLGAGPGHGGRPGPGALLRPAPDRSGGPDVRLRPVRGGGADRGVAQTAQRRGGAHPSTSGRQGDAGKGLWKDPRVRGYLLFGLLSPGPRRPTSPCWAFTSSMSWPRPASRFARPSPSSASPCWPARPPP